MSRIVFLDFDGVLFDTVYEAYAVLLLSMGYINDLSEINFSEDRFIKFRSMRYLVGPASDYLSLLKLVDEKDIGCDNKNINCFFESHKRSFSLSEKKKFQENFFQARQLLRLERPEDWLELNKAYPFFKQLKELLDIYSTCFIIITTKDVCTVLEILNLYGVKSRLQVYGADSFEYYGSKKKVIESCLVESKIHRSVFIDDSRMHLDFCSSIEGMSLLQPDWGYIAPNEEGVSCLDVLSEIKSFLGI